MHGHQSGRRPSTPTLPSPASGEGIREAAAPQGDEYESTVVAEHMKRTAGTEQTFQHSAKPSRPCAQPLCSFHAVQAMRCVFHGEEYHVAVGRRLTGMYGIGRDVEHRSGLRLNVLPADI